MSKEQRTEISTLGRFGLIDRITSGFKPHNDSTYMAAGDDAAVITPVDDKSYSLLTTDLLMEGINFNLTYFPLKHLGYKAVVVGCSDIYAMNGRPQQITISIAVSSKLSVEDIDEFYAGVQAACADYEVDLVGGDTKASINGLVISVTALGSVRRESLVTRSGAKVNDLICITRDLGAAYMGLKLLERERIALEGVPDPQPQFDGYEYLLRRQLKPEARRDVIEALAEEGIVPTSMIDISDGLASEVMLLCGRSHCGARIYLDRIPLAKETTRLAEEMHLDPVTAALNGGDDHELLFTVPLDKQEQIMHLGYGVEVIGHITGDGSGAALVTPDGNVIALKAQGFSTGR